MRSVIWGWVLGVPCPRVVTAHMHGGEQGGGVEYNEGFMLRQWQKGRYKEENSGQMHVLYEANPNLYLRECLNWSCT